MKENIFFKILISSLFLIFVQSCENIKDLSTPTDDSSPYINLANITPIKINTDLLNNTTPKSGDDTVRLEINVSFVETANQDESLALKSIKYELVNQDATSYEYYGEITTTKTSLSGNKGYLHQGILSLVIKRKDIGSYSLKVYGLDSKNRASNSIITNISVIRENHAPVIEKISAPDTITVSSETERYILTALVSDPEGLTDIKKVFFNTYKPDGSPSSGNPFQMYDDGAKTGTSGDDKSGDGIYSLTIQINSQSSKGRYRFDFYVSDKSDSLSAVHQHYIVVK